LFQLIVLFFLSSVSYAQIWSDLSIQQDIYLHAIAFSDSSTGWIAGDSGYVLKSTDAGSSWNKINNFPFTENLLDVQVLDSSTIYFLSGATTSGSYFFVSTDAGETWETNQFFLLNVFITDFHFVNKNTGYAVGLNGQMFKTYDRMQSWEELSDPVNAFPNKKVAFINDSTGFVAGGRFDILGFIKKTNDGGRTWKNVAITIEPINNLYFINEDTIFAVSGDPDLGGWIYRSDDKGENWELLDTLSGFFLLQGIDFSNRNLGWVSGAATILNTTNFGSTWQIVREDSDFVASIASNNGRDFWFVGSNGYIYKYEDTTGTLVNIKDELQSSINIYSEAVFPNPFNSSARIKFYLADAAFTSIELYNILGEKLKTIYNGFKDAGNNELFLEMKDYASGSYLLLFTFDGITRTYKINLIK